MSQHSPRFSARDWASISLCAFALALLGAVNAFAQDAGALRTSGESYHDTLPGESVNGVALNLRQLLSVGGLLNADVLLVDKKDRSTIGRGTLRLSDVAVAGARVTAEGGDLSLKLNASPFHFADDFLPLAYVRGGSLRADTDAISVSLFQGRNEQFQGIRLPTVAFAPEYLTGATASLRAGEALLFDANALRTTNRQPVTNPLFGIPVPDHAETYGVGGTVRLAEFWTAQAKTSYARYEYAPGSLAASGHFLSYVGGTAIDSDRWKAQADYIRLGANYIPLSTASVGNREGPHVLVQSLNERWIATASFSSYRNNLESNSNVPDLRSQSLFGSALYRLTRTVSTTLSYNQQDLTSGREGESSRFTQKTAASELNFPSLGYTRLRYQYQTTDEPSLHQRLHEIGVEQQPPSIRGVSLVAGVRFQHATEGTSSLLYRGGLTGSIRDVHFSVNGEWGNDLASSTVFALNRSQIVTAALSVPLPGEIELQVEGYWNRVSAVINPESIFVSQATQEQLFSFNRRALLVRLARSFQWGRQPATTQSLAYSAALPYGLVEGFVFQDLNGNGRRDPGEPPASGIVVLLDDGQAAKTDAAGRFAFPNVIEGDHTVRIDLEVLPVSYNAPSEPFASVHVRRLRPGQHDFGLIPTGSLAGRVEQALSTGKRIGFGGAVVTLLPNDFSTYTDTDGSYSFSNLPPGRYSIRLEEASLPEGAVIETGSSQEKNVAAGQDLAFDPLVFSLRVEEKPVQRIFEQEQTVRPPSSGRRKSASSGSSGSRSSSRSR